MNKKKVLIGVGMAVLIVLCIGIAIYAGTGGTNYYTQIDNTKVKEIDPHGAMNYSYTLTAYDENGKKRDVTFETSKILRDEAYLCLKTAPIRGVVNWEEVEYTELPSAVQTVYSE
ncbi:YxeA family protein [Roseburia hominis]